MSDRSDTYRQQLSALENTASNGRTGVFVDDRDQPLKICIARTVKDAIGLEAKIKAHGGAVVSDEKTAFIRLADPGRSYEEVMYSTAWVDDCIQEHRLINHYLPMYRLRTGTRSVREPFTITDDRLLREFVRTKKEAGAKMNGNLIYEEFAQMHKQHTAQSWRERAVKDLKLTMPPSPYEISKAKREEATKRRQESQQEESARQRQSSPPGTEPPVTTDARQRLHQPSLSTEISAKDSASGNVFTNESHTEEAVISHPQPAPAELSDFDVLSFSEISSNEEEDDFHRSQMSQLSQQRSNGKQYRASTPPLLPAKEEAPQKKHTKSIPDDWPQSPTPQSWRNSPQAYLTLPDSLSPPLPAAPIASDIELTDDDDIVIEQTILERKQISSPVPAAASEDQVIVEREPTPSSGRTISNGQAPPEGKQTLSPEEAITLDEQTILDREQASSPGRAVTPDEQTILDREQSSPGSDIAPDEQGILDTEHLSSPEGDVVPGEPTVLEREQTTSPGRASTLEEQSVLDKEQTAASERSNSLGEQGSRTRESSSSSVEPLQQDEDSPQQDSFVDFELPAKLLTARPSKLRQGVLRKARSERILKGRGKAKDKALESEEEDEEEKEEEQEEEQEEEEVEEEEEEEEEEQEEEGQRSDSVASKSTQRRTENGHSQELDTTLEMYDTIDLDSDRSSEEAHDELAKINAEALEAEDNQPPIQRLVQVQQDEDEEEEEEEERLIRRRPAHMRARPLVKKPIAAPKKPMVNEAHVRANAAETQDAIQEFYGPVGDEEEATKREQLVLYLRNIFKNQVRILMQYELVPPLKAIDILDACSGDLKLARLFVNEGMTESDQSRFWTREDDRKVFSTRNEDVMDLMHKHSPVELVQRTNYLITTRNAAERFVMSANAAPSTGLLKRRAAVAPESDSGAKRLHVNA
ncbi:hypothetical protein BGZ72_003382 [Mortierella alpina]|nr:hypothetical protein BGZ72_003382 [Mortierella alpina]